MTTIFCFVFEIGVPQTKQLPNFEYMIDTNFKELHIYYVIHRFKNVKEKEKFF